jgi:hypothetical protein
MDLTVKQFNILEKFDSVVQMVSKRVLFNNPTRFDDSHYKNAYGEKESILFQVATDELKKDKYSAALIKTIGEAGSATLAKLNSLTNPPQIEVNQWSRCFAHGYDWQYFMETQESKALQSTLILAGAVILEKRLSSQPLHSSIYQWSSQS